MSLQGEYVSSTAKLNPIPYNHVRSLGYLGIIINSMRVQFDHDAVYASC